MSLWPSPRHRRTSCPCRGTRPCSEGPVPHLDVLVPRPSRSRPHTLYPVTLSEVSSRFTEETEQRPSLLPYNILSLLSLVSSFFLFLSLSIFIVCFLSTSDVSGNVDDGYPGPEECRIPLKPLTIECVKSFRYLFCRTLVSPERTQILVRVSGGCSEIFPY